MQSLHRINSKNSIKKTLRKQPSLIRAIAYKNGCRQNSAQIAARNLQEVVIFLFNFSISDLFFFCCCAKKFKNISKMLNIK
jgi:hypothetical protein